jgi:hypothetical protein
MLTRGFIMNKHLIAAVLIAASAAVTNSAFATDSSDTAQHYDQTAGTTASQHGPNIQTIAVDQGDANHRTQAFGGTADTLSQSGTRLAAPAPLASHFGSLYSHH